MCTYQGEDYLQQQLQSILEQSKKPDEVVICDDGSTDSTITIINNFIEENNLKDSWKLYCNSENIGFVTNFYSACRLCSGDIIFFADQDDIWYPDKVEEMCKVFEEVPEAKVVCCKFGIIDAENKKIKSVTNPVRSKETGKVRNLSVKDLFFKCEWPSMVLAFSSEWYLSWESISDSTEIPNDYLFCAKASEENGFYQLDKELALHRIHDNNTGKEEYKLFKILNKQRKIEEINEYLRILDAFKNEKIFNCDNSVEELEAKKAIMQSRKKVLESGKISSVIKNWMKNRKSIRTKTFLCDLWIIKQKLKQ